MDTAHSGARMFARALFATTIALAAIWLAVVMLPVNATTSDGLKVSCGSIGSDKLTTLRLDAQQQQSQLDSDNVARAIAGEPTRTAVGVYAQYDACQAALNGRSPWAWMTAGGVLVTLIVGVTLALSARTPRRA